MKRWRAGCDGMISVNSIFASFAGGLAAVVVAFTQRTIVFQLSVALLMIAFILFARAAETITDAVERDDVLLYQAAHQQYNVGVVLVLVSLSILLFVLHYRYAALIPVLCAWNPWLRDVIWLLRKPAEEWQKYIKEISSEDT